MTLSNEKRLAKAPRLDSEGYHESFSLDEKVKIKTYFEENGYVVVRDILDKESCKQTVNEIWNILEGKIIPPSGIDRAVEDTRVDRNNPTTWDKAHGWTNYTEYGILGKIVASTPMAWKNRHNRKYYDLYRLLLGTDHLFSKIDRYGIVRPTKNVLQTDGVTVKDYPERSTQFPIHWDVDIYNYVNGKEDHDVGIKSKLTMADLLYENNKVEQDPLIIQGILTLKDCNYFDGGFQCVPGFHKRSRLEQFVKSHPQEEMNMFNSSYLIDPKDPILQDLVRVPMRAGSFVCFNSLLPHASFPNESPDFRIVQYMRFYPSRLNDPRFQKFNYLKHRQEILQDLMPPSMLKDPWVRQLNGFEPYSQSPTS